MRPLMRFAEAMHDNEVRKASKAAIAAIPDARKACDALTALTGIGVATASVCLAAVDDRLPVMSDEALEAVLGEPEHAKKYDLDSYQRLLEACSAKAKKLGGLWTPRAVEEALFSASASPPAKRRQTQARRLERRVDGVAAAASRRRTPSTRSAPSTVGRASPRRRAARRSPPAGARSTAGGATRRGGASRGRGRGRRRRRGRPPRPARRAREGLAVLVAEGRLDQLRRRIVEQGSPRIVAHHDPNSLFTRLGGRPAAPGSVLP